MHLSEPRRDARRTRRIFCSGSGEFAASAALPVSEQLAQAKRLVAAKAGPDARYIAYFQDYSNTYTPADQLRPLFLAAIDRDEICALSIATRPDCLPPGDPRAARGAAGKGSLSGSSLAYRRSTHPLRGISGAAIPFPCLTMAVRQLKALDIHVVAHMILGLPGETPEMMVQTARYIGQSGADGIKLHLLHVLSGTDLAEDYAAGNFETMTLDAYLSVLEDCLRVLPRELVIHRMTGDGAKRSLIAPMWSADKKRVLNALNRRFLSDDLEQGSALLL